MMCLQKTFILTLYLETRQRAQPGARMVEKRVLLLLMTKEDPRIREGDLISKVMLDIYQKLETALEADDWKYASKLLGDLVMMRGAKHPDQLFDEEINTWFPFLKDMVKLPGYLYKTHDEYLRG